MRYLVGFVFVLALGLMGCSETAGTGGSGGDGGSAGTGGIAGAGGSGGTGGAMPECESPEDCDDGEECTTNACTEGACEYTPVVDGTTCDVGEGGCQDGSCLPCRQSCPCTFPLDEYCKGSDCPSWEEAIAAAEKFAAESGCDWGGCAASAGRCGEFRYVQKICRYDESIKYFDDSGMLVAVYLWSDGCGFWCPGSCSVDYGFRAECQLEQEQIFCGQNE
jgi:hypothetical protein